MFVQLEVMFGSHTLAAVTGRKKMFPGTSCSGKFGNIAFWVTKYIGIGTIPGCFLLHFQTIRKLVPNMPVPMYFLLEMSCL